MGNEKGIGSCLSCGAAIVWPEVGALKARIAELEEELRLARLVEYDVDHTKTLLAIVARVEAIVESWRRRGEAERIDLLILNDLEEALRAEGLQKPDRIRELAIAERAAHSAMLAAGDENDLEMDRLNALVEELDAEIERVLKEQEPRDVGQEILEGVRELKKEEDQ